MLSFLFVAAFMYLLHGVLDIYLRDPFLKINWSNGMIEGILIGLTTALTFQNIFMVMIGCFFGTIIGMLPGLGPMTAIALMIPITYGFDPATGLILMAGVYYGAVFGGSTSSILLNAPGVPGTVATSFDGYPMAQQGKAGKALAIAAWSSFAGGTLICNLFIIPSPKFIKSKFIV
jgi:putative tricarboxylic transport membrane protein